MCDGTIFSVNKYLGELSETVVFTNLSKYEAYNIVIAETFAMGIPIVILDLGGGY